MRKTNNKKVILLSILLCTQDTAAAASSTDPMPISPRNTAPVIHLAPLSANITNPGQLASTPSVTIQDPTEFVKALEIIVFNLFSRPEMRRDEAEYEQCSREFQNVRHKLLKNAPIAMDNAIGINLGFVNNPCQSSWSLLTQNEGQVRWRLEQKTIVLNADTMQEPFFEIPVPLQKMPWIKEPDTPPTVKIFSLPPLAVRLPLYQGIQTQPGAMPPLVEAQCRLICVSGRGIYSITCDKTASVKAIVEQIEMLLTKEIGGDSVRCTLERNGRNLNSQDTIGSYLTAGQNELTLGLTCGSGLLKINRNITNFLNDLLQDLSKQKWTQQDEQDRVEQIKTRLKEISRSHLSPTFHQCHLTFTDENKCLEIKTDKYRIKLHGDFNEFGRYLSQEMKWYNVSNGDMLLVVKGRADQTDPITIALDSHQETRTRRRVMCDASPDPSLSLQYRSSPIPMQATQVLGSQIKLSCNAANGHFLTIYCDSNTGVSEVMELIHAQHRANQYVERDYIFKTTLCKAGENAILDPRMTIGQYVAAGQPELELTVGFCGVMSVLTDEINTLVENLCGLLDAEENQSESLKEILTEIQNISNNPLSFDLTKCRLMFGDRRDPISVQIESGDYRIKVCPGTTLADGVLSSWYDLQGNLKFRCRLEAGRVTISTACYQKDIQTTLPTISLRQILELPWELSTNA